MEIYCTKEIKEEDIIKEMKADSTYPYFFYIKPLTKKAICKMCLSEFTYSQRTTGTSTLKRHLENHHEAVMEAKQNLKQAELKKQTTLKGFCNKKRTKYSSEIDERTKYVLMLCRSKHILPFQFFEDPVIYETLGIEKIARNTVRREIIKIACQLRLDVLENNRGKWASIALDGWKNTVTGDKHISVVLFFCDAPQKPVFIQSHTIEYASADNICDLILQTLEYLDTYDIVVIAAITDNASNMISAMVKLNNKRPTILPIRCASHICNLIIHDLFNQIGFLKAALDILKEYIEAKRIARFVATRWNSVFDKMKELSNVLEKEENSNKDHLLKLNTAIMGLVPLIELLNLSQKDGVGWRTIMQQYRKVVFEYQEAGRDAIVNVILQRESFIKNPIVMLNDFLYEGVELFEDTTELLCKWLNSLKISAFEEWIADHILCGKTKIPQKLDLFFKYKLPKISISEAAVERCFGVHKRIHSLIRTSLTNDIVEDLLFIRYNYTSENEDETVMLYDDVESNCVPLFRFDED